MSRAALDQAWADYKLRAEEGTLMSAADMAGATLKRAGHEMVGPCPACGGTDRFSINEAKRKWNCRGAEGGGTRAGLYMHAASVDYKRALEDLTGEAPPSGQSGGYDEEARQRARERRERAIQEQAERERQEAEEDEKSIDAAQRLWQGAIDPAGTLSDVYMGKRVRGWDGFNSDQVRHHPSAFYAPGIYLPCTVWLIVDDGNNPIGVQRIFHDRDGNKANVPDAKKMLGRPQGGACRLFPHDNGTIGLCEGGESAYGAWFLTMRTVPIWPTFSTSGMSGFAFPFEIGRVITFPDGDMYRLDDAGNWHEPPGKVASDRLIERARAEGLVGLQHPTEWNGKDPLDVWNEISDKMQGVAA